MASALGNFVLRLVFLPGLVIAAGLYTIGVFFTIDVAFPIVQAVLLALGRKEQAESFAAITRGTFTSPYVFHIERFGGLTLEVYGEKLRADEKAIVICNHRSWMDSVILFSLGRQCGRDGDLKFVAKKSLVLFPVYGQASYFTNICIFIQRSSEKAKNAFSKSFEQLTHRSTKRPYWLVSYQEGTRLTKKKLLESQAFAKKRDLPVLERVLLPRVKGFSMMVEGLGNDFDAIYDVTLAYGNDEKMNPLPTFADVLTLFSLGKPRVVQVYQRRIDAKTLPRDPEELSKFLYELYESKDRLLREQETTGKFPGARVPWRRETMRRATTTYFGFLAMAGLICGSAWYMFETVV